MWGLLMHVQQEVDKTAETSYCIITTIWLLRDSILSINCLMLTWKVSLWLFNPLWRGGGTIQPQTVHHIFLARVQVSQQQMQMTEKCNEQRQLGSQIDPQQFRGQHTIAVAYKAEPKRLEALLNYWLSFIFMRIKSVDTPYISHKCLWYIVPAHNNMHMFARFNVHIVHHLSFVISKIQLSN